MDGGKEMTGRVMRWLVVMVGLGWGQVTSVPPPSGGVGAASVGASGRVNTADGNGGWIDSGIVVSGGGFVLGAGTTDYEGTPVAFSTVTVESGRIYCGPNSEDSNIFSCKYSDGSVYRLTKEPIMSTAGVGYVPLSLPYSTNGTGTFAANTVRYVEYPPLSAAITAAKASVYVATAATGAGVYCAVRLYKSSDCSALSPTGRGNSLTGINSPKPLTFTTAATITAVREPVIVGFYCEDTTVQLSGVGATPAAMINSAVIDAVPRIFTVAGDNASPSGGGATLELPASCSGARTISSSGIPALVLLP
jgi:hypothetical protein